MSLEKIKLINNYSGYLVSSWGKVYRIERLKQVMDDSRENWEIDTQKLVEITPQETSKGYLRVGLYKNGKRKWHKVHRLVANAFIPNPEGKAQVNHIDGNKQNNSVTNLEWVTDAENKEHYKQITDKEKLYDKS